MHVANGGMAAMEELDPSITAKKRVETIAIRATWLASNVS